LPNKGRFRRSFWAAIGFLGQDRLAVLTEARSDKRVAEKHDIRCELHHQLRREWQCHPDLRGYLNVWEKKSRTEQAATLGNKANLIQPFTRGPFTFVPLVTCLHSLICTMRGNV
jgi:hypothetical protein